MTKNNFFFQLLQFAEFGLLESFQISCPFGDLAWLLRTPVAAISRNTDSLLERHGRDVVLVGTLISLQMVVMLLLLLLLLLMLMMVVLVLVKLLLHVVLCAHMKVGG
jgi:hypothetical protein